MCTVVKDFHRLDNFFSQARQNFVKGMINFYHRLDNSFFCLPFVILNEVKDLASMLLRFFALLKMTGAFVCFLDSYLLFFLFGLSNCLRIRGYLIKYPRIFHHVSVDISLRIHGYAKFLLFLCG